MIRSVPTQILSMSLTLCLAAASAISAVADVHVVNHQDFAIRMPVRLSDGQSVLIDAPAKGTAKAQSLRVGNAPLNMKAKGNAAWPHFNGANLGRLSAELVLADAGDATSWTLGTIVRQAEPVDFTFVKQSGGNPEMWSAETTTAGLKIAALLEVYPDGFLDVTTRVTNSSVDPAKKYCAVVWKWEQRDAKNRSVCYDDRIGLLKDGDDTRFRRPWPGQSGDIRHLQVQRGVDWVKSELGGGTGASSTSTASLSTSTRTSDKAYSTLSTQHSVLGTVSVVWMNDFAESFTAKRKLSGKAGAKFRWATANQAHYGQEALARHVGVVYHITEIARANRTYRDRVVDSTLPGVGESAEFTSRIIFTDEKVSDKRADEMFVGYTCYRTETKTGSGIELTFGVPRVRFGTNYFPYSTLGENLDSKKLPGMDREGFWPLAADTVTQWKLFADDIRRDLRIARAMGFELIRLHHLELLNPIDPKIRTEYLDFLFGELRHLGLKTLIDAAWTPEEIAALVSKYRDLIDGVEIDNEVLIWGIDDGKPAEWNRIYDAVKAVAPDMPVHLTCHTNVGIFNKLEELGGKFDKIGSHAYQDSVDSIPSSRGFALAVGNFAAKVGKEPIITEWNWRNLTRLTEEERAPLIRDIFGNALVTRSIPTFYEFQFNETLCPNPRIGRGNILRHYELLHLSRRPKQDALVLMELMRAYGSPADVLTTRVVVELGSDGTGTGTLALAANVKEPERVRLIPETAQGSRLDLEPEINLRSGAVTTFPFRLDAGTTTPGFYHAFVRIQKADGTMAGYAWIEGRLSGIPKYELNTTDGIRFLLPAQYSPFPDFSRPTAVIFGDQSSVLEAETAILIAETLESASGRPVPFLVESALDRHVTPTTNLIIVGTTETCKLVSDEAAKQSMDRPPEQPYMRRYGKDMFNREEQGVLIISGQTSEEVEQAGIHFALRYWVHAKDSAARKVGLVAKPLPRKGPDPGALP